jgi:hypothetical protein
MVGGLNLGSCTCLASTLLLNPMPNIPNIPLYIALTFRTTIMLHELKRQVTKPGSRDVVQVVECFPNMHKALG